MQTVLRSLPFAALGLLSVACFSSKTTKVEPGATNVQPTVQCLDMGSVCHSSADCCSGQCSDNVCAYRK